MRVLFEVGVTMTPGPAGGNTILSRQTKWLRASRSGILHLEADLGTQIGGGETIATIFDPFGKRISRISAPEAGLVIGHREHPLVNQGDAVAHIAFV